jgi:D-glycero-alpha-D-manno-heptose-7-phosphate kinase
VFAHAQAPVRIGIAGGGTDLPAWTSTGRVGRCLSLAVKMYTHAVAIHRPDGQVVASYRKRDVSNCATEIANGLIRESALLHGWEDSFEVHTLSELSSKGSGLGVSSSIAVSLAACFQKLAQLRDSHAGKTPHAKRENFPMTAALDAWTVEIDKLRRPIGRQDHMAAAHGGLHLYAFEGADAMVLRSFSQEDARWVAEHLLLVQLPDGHDSRAILSGVKTTEALEAAAAAVPFATAAIEKRDAQLLGQAIRGGQASKLAIRGAVTEEVTAVLRTLERVSGVHGCKVAGAGGGGHVVVACEPGSAGAVGRAVRLPVLEVEADHGGVRSDGWL